MSFPILPTPAQPGLAAAAERPAANCQFRGGCGEVASPALAEDVAARVKNHPCYSESAHHHFARMHVAVAAACNIQCHYCNRKFDCANESRPGVVSERLTPAEALRKVLAVAAEIPQLAVVGIAGPGDPLANPSATFETMELVRRAAPDLQLCLSTNGLALPDHVDRIAALGVGHVTVTVNMTDPEVGERIYPWVAWKGRRVSGRDAARLLSERQLDGIARLREKKILCKVNSVVIPGVNDAHLVEVSRAVMALGAFTHNLMPLLSSPEHGTHYGRTGQRGPTRDELEKVQASCEGTARVMRHCRQCRADAVGLLGEDRNGEFALARLPPEPAQDAADVRAAHRAGVERVRALAERARDEALARLSGAPPGLRARLAVATKGGGIVNQHFGHAREFQVYEVSRDGARFVSVRKVEAYCRGGEGEEDVLEAVLRALSDCRAVLVAKVGHCPKGRLAAAGIEPVVEEAHRPIEAAALSWFAGFVARVEKGEVRFSPPPGALPEPAAAVA
ncbi:MAG TPA: nitrogenase cofactor biosynthesis protein NifB [Anaeromyxobacteraceae bacterium]|nr:nitrogenase cofactor biosynthesis protein NifB [Anaeromyxobacteraceae bacterium]